VFLWKVLAFQTLDACSYVKCLLFEPLMRVLTKSDCPSNCVGILFAVECLRNSKRLNFSCVPSLGDVEQAGIHTKNVTGRIVTISLAYSRGRQNVVSAPPPKHTISRVGQNLIYTLYMIVYLVISLPTYRIYTGKEIHIWFCPTLAVRLNMKRQQFGTAHWHMC